MSKFDSVSCGHGFGTFFSSIRNTKSTGYSRYAVSFLLAIVLMMCAGCTASQKPAVTPLHVENGALCDSQGKTIQLRGVSTHGIEWYGEYLNAGMMRTVKEAGGNVVRIAMYTDTERGYVHAPEENLRRVIAGIEDAIAEDMYVIVDWHILNDGDPMMHITEAINFFDALASRYPDTPNILYEICNEPNGTSWPTITEYAYQIIGVIRQYAPDAVVIVGVPEYSSQLSFAWFDPINAENLLYAYHYYAGEHWNWKALEEAMEKHFPVFVSEWGIGEGGSEDAEKFLQFLNRKKISWCAWSLCNKDEPYSLLRPESMNYGNFTEEDFSEAGKLIFRYLGK
ncbi:MAG: glycoside hydrolase family 5 protein [Solobacterium sp.]|nr:glycoside hydrolase family 5 protein [Solobacterium sp.]